MSFWMRFIDRKNSGKYRADEFFYRAGKGLWLPVCVAGFWFAQRGYERYGALLTCAIRDMCGFPCPGCGGTRAFYYLFKGELGRSLALNPGVAFLFLAYLHFMLLSFYRKHMGGRGQKEIQIQYYGYGFIAVLLIQWGIKIVKVFMRIF